MTDMISPSTHFCNDNFPVMRQLKPFRFYDDAAQAKILESAFTKLDGKNKQYYVDKAGKRFYALMPKLYDLREGKATKTDVANAFEIYSTEMRLILLQDPGFVKNHFHQLEAVIKEGWKGLKDEQRIYYFERTIVFTDDSPSTYVGEDAPAYTPPVNRRRTHFTHDNSWLTNSIDSLAFDGYVIDAQYEDSSLDPNMLWMEWVYDLDQEDHDYYYSIAYQTAAWSDAPSVFMAEKQTIKLNDNNRLEYAAEQKQLKQAWDDLSDKAKKVYFKLAYEKYIENDKHPETRFVGRFNSDRSDLDICVSTMDDVNAYLAPRPPFNNWQTLLNNENRVAIVYITKMRPELLKQPGMEKKRYWEINSILNDQWNNMSEDEQQTYYNMVHRYHEIRRTLRKWKLDGRNVADMDIASFAKLDAETKKKHFKIALQNRKVLLKKYPDLHEYFDYYTSNMTPASLSSDIQSTVTVNNDVESVDQIPSYNSIVDVHMNDVDNSAFWQYTNTVATMTSKHMDRLVWWKQFVNLSDEERNVYYNEAHEKIVLKTASSLFADDNSPVCKSDKDEAYAKEIPNLFHIWERLSGPAKEYYIELAEQKVLARQNAAKEKKNKIEKDETAFEFGDKPDGARGWLSSKSNVNSFNNDQKNAFIIYLEKHLEDLSKEPGMTDKRYFQLAMILEQRFKNLSKEEQQPYFHTAKRITSIYEHNKNFPENWSTIYTKKFGYRQRWQDASDEDRFVCEEEAKQNVEALLQQFPDVGDYFFWVVRNSTLKKLNKKTDKSATKKSKTIKKSTKKVSKKTESTDLEVVNNVQKEEAEIDKQKTGSAELISVKIQELAIDGNTSMDFKTAGTWEVVNDEKTSEGRSLKSADTKPVHGNESETSAN